MRLGGHPPPGAIGTLLAFGSAALLALTPPAGGQHPSHEADARALTPNLAVFLETLERANRRFADVDVAIREGYRKLGPDFPGMGEHWIHPGRVIASELDPTAPPVITYSRIAGTYRLLGFAYTSALGPDDEVPDHPFPRTAWHDHAGGVDEESMLLSGPASLHGTGEGYRLAMVHIWIPLENPDGVVSQNNWRLPAMRAGLASVIPMTSEASRAMSLGGVGLDFYEQVLRDGVGMEADDLVEAMDLFERAAARTQEVRAALGPDGTLTADDVRTLEHIWYELWRAMDASGLPSSYRRLSQLGHGTHH